MATYLDPGCNSLVIGESQPAGAYTQDRYEGDNSTTWAAGQLVILSSGKIAAISSSGGSGIVGYLDTDDIAAGAKIFIARKAVAEATDNKVAVEQITQDTIIEAPLVSSDSSGSAIPTEPVIGGVYGLWQDTNGNFWVDKYITSKTLVTIVDIESNFRPFTGDYPENSSGVRYNRVRVKFNGISNL
jgi:hypothetical protein